MSLPRATSADAIIRLKGAIWNQLLDLVESRGTIIGVGGIDVFNASGSTVLSLAKPDETAAIRIDSRVTSSVDTRRGLYQGTLLQDPADPADEDVAVSDFGDASSTTVIVENAAELRGSPPLKADGSVVVIGRVSGNNNSAGDESFQGQPLYQVDAYVSPLQSIPVTSDGGDAGDDTTDCSFTYAGTWPDGTAFTATAPTAPNRMSKVQYVPASEGLAVWRNVSGTWQWILVSVLDETPMDTDCSEEV